MGKGRAMSELQAASVSTSRCGGAGAEATWRGRAWPWRSAQGGIQGCLRFVCNVFIFNKDDVLFC